MGLDATAAALWRRWRTLQLLTVTAAPELTTTGAGGGAGRRPITASYGRCRWASEIRDRTRGHRIWIGTYDTAEAAARAYDAEARSIHGGKARINFPIQQEAAADK
ncbi:hypothetical protein ABZP36_010232 [Zizania latifolia]